MQFVTGSDDGLQTNNSRGAKVEPLITPDVLKAAYLTGLNITDPTTGEPLPDSTYNIFINNAVSWMEHYLDLSITEVTNHVENLDYYVNSYAQYGYMSLHNIPVIGIHSIEFVYFRDESGQPETVQEIPGNWIRLHPHDGTIRLIPNARFPGTLAVGGVNGSSFFPRLLSSDFIPDLWRVTYDFGFKDGKIPIMLNATIAKLAALQALTVGGNLVIDPGIAASSISLDGLSQSIQTTQSPENSAYSATIKELSGFVFGRSKEDRFSELRLLKDFYKGADFNII